MSRQYGLMVIPGHIEPQIADSLDGRAIFTSVDSLFETDAFVSSDGFDYSHVGMMALVTEGDDYGVFVLMALPSTSASNWRKLMRGDPDMILDYVEHLKNRPTINGVEIINDLDIADIGFTFLSIKVVDVLPAPEDGEWNVIYLVPNNDDVGNPENVYEEWLLQMGEDGVAYFEYLGISSYDMSNYYTKEEVDALRTFVNATGAAAYTNYGAITEGTALENVTLADLINKLFFPEAEPVVTDPSVEMQWESTVGMSGILVEVPYEVTIDKGDISCLGVSQGEAAGDDTLIIMIDGEAQEDITNPISIIPGEAGTAITIAGGVTLGDGPTPLKSDGTASTTVAAFEEETFAFDEITVESIGAAYVNGVAIDVDKVNLVEGYIEVEVSYGDVVSFDIDYYGGASGIQALNGFTGAFAWLGGSQVGSLSYFNISTSDGVYSCVNYFADSVLRFYYGGDYSFYLENYDEETGVTTISLSNSAKTALINGSSFDVWDGEGPLPALPEIDGDVSLSYLFSGIAVKTLDLTNFDTSNVVDMSYMCYNCTSLTSIDISSFDFSNTLTTESMFEGCSKLTSVIFGGDE